ncbi:MFS transporter [Lysinibacillus sp. NPDC059133]|uniref:MFS transporter n=1 Tax=Lysinibacillus sp. NPDC059133 TaxID=3346737 RepID=UPI003694C31B
MIMNNPYIKVFKNKSYAKMFFAYLTSQVGTVTGLTAFAFYLLDRFSEQPYYTTLAEIMYSLPALLLFFLTGVLADSLDRKKIAINCDIISAILTLIILFSIHLDILPLVFALLFIRSGVIKFFEPASISIVKGVLTKEEFPFAMGLNQMLMSIFLILGSSLGATSYWLFGIKGAILIDLASFLISAYLISICKVPREVRMPNGEIKLSELKFPNIIMQFKEGINYIIRNKILLSIFVGVLILGIVEGGESVMKLFMLKYKLAPADFQIFVIWLNSIYGIGIFLGSLAASTKLIRNIAFHHMITYTILVMGCTHFIQALIPNVGVFLSLHFIYAFTIPLCNIALFGWLGQLVEGSFMGRVQALINPVMMLTFTTTQGLIAISFPKLIEIEFLFFLVGTCEIILFAYFAISLPHLIKKGHSNESEEKYI